MKYIYNIICLTSLLVLLSCQKEESLDEVKFIGIDKISKIELSPNSPQLIANGKARLDFKVKCYYIINDTVEVPMIMDRIPIKEIKITSSENKTFELNKGYTSSGKTDSVYFTCTIGNKTSAKVSVALTPPTQPVYDKVVVPIIFHAIYTEKKQNNIKGFTPELLQKIIDRANKVFAGELSNAPSSCPSGIQFKLERISKRKISPNENIQKYISDNLMTEPDKYLNIWVMDAIPWSLSSDNCVPIYTFGDPENIKGLRLKQISTIDEIKNVKPVNVGITMSFGDIYQMESGYTSNRFETQLGRYYGLLNTGHYDEKKELTDGDLDYCPDTYSYISRELTQEKRTFPINGEKGKHYFYDSFNIMDTYSSCTTISRDQVKRIRQVITDCAFRQMKR